MNIQSPFGKRLGALLVALLLVLGGTIGGLYSAWQHVQQLEAKLSSSRLESFRLAGEVQRGLLNLNNSMLHYGILRDPREWVKFERASGELNHWMDRHDPSMNSGSWIATDDERLIFQELNHAFDTYLAAAGVVHAKGDPPLLNPGQLDPFGDFDAQALRMGDLAQKLADAHRRSEAVFLGDANVSLSNLRVFLIGSLMMLLILVVAMGGVIYRDLIAPLRMKLIQSQTLLERQEKLATLGTLAAGIAHEIRNPLTSLKARLFTLEKHLLLVPAARQDTDIISGEIFRLEHIVQDVLSFAQPAEPRMSILGSREILHEVHELMAPGLQGLGVQLSLAPGVDCSVRGDRGHLKQVLINLVRNGAEAIDGAGVVTLQARVARATFPRGEADAVILEVIDTGKGISAETEKRLFDPFFSTKEAGTGLGLSIAARIVERQGGMLQYQTCPGHGTTFGVVLPRAIQEFVPNTACEN